MTGSESSQARESSHKGLHDCTADLALAAELALQDIHAIASSRKGKANIFTAKTDEEMAFEMLEEEARALLAFTQDIVFARSLDEALRTDHDYIQEILRADEVARSDKEYALALSQGRAPPSTSTSDSLSEALST